MCKTFVKNSLLLSYYSLYMTNTVFPKFQTQYIRIRTIFVPIRILHFKSSGSATLVDRRRSGMLPETPSTRVHASISHFRIDPEQYNQIPAQAMGHLLLRCCCPLYSNSVVCVCGNYIH
jgi:hypothetical protein